MQRYVETWAANQWQWRTRRATRGAEARMSGLGCGSVTLSGLILAVLAPSAFAQATMHVAFPSSIDKVLVTWFILTGLTVLYLAWDLFTRTPAMKVMKWGWLLVALYTGPVAFVVYWLSCREPVPGTHESFVAPQWKQTVGSTIHCMAGDATGVIVAAAITGLLHTPMWLDSIVEYVAGFFFGLFIFQALFMKDMLGGSYMGAVRATVLPEWLSMNGVMAGMIPTMVILMSHDMEAMHPASLRFWGIMSLATLVGAVPSYPINWWLVSKGMKHGMGTERALGRGGSPVLERGAAGAEMANGGPHQGAARHAQTAPHAGAPQRGSGTVSHTGTGHGGPDNGSNGQHDRQVSAASKVAMAALSVALLGIGILTACNYGNFSMSAATMASAVLDESTGAGADDHVPTSSVTASSHQ